MAAPSKKPGSKGLPPEPTKTTHVVGNHTSKPEPGTTVPCNFRVSMVEVFETAVNEYMERKGGA